MLLIVTAVVLIVFLIKRRKKKKEKGTNKKVQRRFAQRIIFIDFIVCLFVWFQNWFVNFHQRSFSFTTSTTRTPRISIAINRSDTIFRTKQTKSMFTFVWNCLFLFESAHLIRFCNFRLNQQLTLHKMNIFLHKAYTIKLMMILNHFYNWKQSYSFIPWYLQQLIEVLLSTRSNLFLVVFCISSKQTQIDC